jgi:hypothetical protein
MEGWASTDPVNAAKYYAKHPAQFKMVEMMGGRREWGMGDVGLADIIAGEWAKQDPAGAMEWAAGLKSYGTGAMTAVITQVAKSDPAKAAEMAGGMAADDQGDVYQEIARQWGTMSFTEAAAWANGLPENQRAGALSAAIKGLAQSDPARAAAEIAKLNDAEARRAVIPAVAKNYARSDLQGSMNWLSSLEDDGAKADSMHEVMRIWAVADGEAALGFIRSQTSSRLKDEAAEIYIWANRSSPPEQLAEVAGMISDESGRSRAANIVAKRWMLEDKEAATQFIIGSDMIDAETKKRVLSGRPIAGDE